MTFLFKRFITSLISIVAVLLLTFTLLHLIPGGPFDSDRELPPEIKKNLYEKYQLKAQGEQNFFVWLFHETKSYTKILSQGNLGPSLKYKDRDVGEIIKEAFPASLILGFGALIISAGLGIFLGVYSSMKKFRFLNLLINGQNLLWVSLPSFIIALLLIYFLSVKLTIFPPALWESSGHAILPILALSLFPLAYFTELTRKGIEKEETLTYFKAARAKGLKEIPIYFKHALKNASLPLLTLTAPIAASLLTGSFVIEKIFAIPGLGQHFVLAVLNRDYFLVMGITFIYASLLISLNFIVDLFYNLLDPRIRIQS